MWCAQTVKPEGADGGGREHERLVAEERLAGEDRDDLADDAERRQDQDVDLRVAEEPEHVLPQDGVAALGRVEEPAAVVPVDEQHHQAGGDHRDGEHQQDAGHERGPAEHRHAQQGHARRAHPEDRDQEVDGAQQRAGARPGSGPGSAGPRRSPAPGRRAGRTSSSRPGAPPNTNAHHDQQAAGEHQPERQGVDARERHVRGADLERHDVVREARGHGHHEQEDHRRRRACRTAGCRSPRSTNWRPGRPPAPSG